MKRFLFLLTVLTSLPLLAQTEVNSFFSGANEGVTYYLPDTEIEIKVNATCINRTPGEFNRYAERYLRINDVMTTAENYWEMTDIQVTTNGKPNVNKMYTIKLNGSTAGNISLCKNGIIRGINITGNDTEEPENKQQASNRKPIDASQYMTEEMLQATSTAKLAELTAKEIFAIRESKLAITRGLSESMPKDGQSMQLILDELTKQEEALTALFIGHSDTTYYSCTYKIEPTYGNDTTKAVLFRFSRKLGFVDKDDLAGEPVYYTLRDMKTVHIPTPEEIEKKKILKKEGVCYNIPGKAEFVIFTRNKKITSNELGIAQFGVTEILSKDLFNKRAETKVTFDTATGGILSIEK